MRPGAGDECAREHEIQPLPKDASGRVPRTERLSVTRQRRYWEHTLTSEWDYARHVDYVHVNPLKHGYVQRLADWPYSTFHRYVAEGILPIDWCGDGSNLSTMSE